MLDVAPHEGSDITVSETREAGEHEGLLCQWVLGLCRCHQLQFFLGEVVARCGNFCNLLVCIQRIEGIGKQHSRLHGIVEYLRQLMLVGKAGAWRKGLGVAWAVGVLVGVLQIVKEVNDELLVNLLHEHPGAMLVCQV